MTARDQISPDWVRISTAAAIELGLAPGKIAGCGCGCINLLQNYPHGCAANCSYCGLARERPGAASDNSFIRVAWPLFRTDLVAERIAERERRGGVGTVCIAQVHDGRAFRDLIDMTERVRRAAPQVPISALVSAGLLDDERLAAIQSAGADIIGIGLDAASPEVFEKTRGSGVRGPHDWQQHWAIARAARRRFGAFKVNFHVVVGLGETDRELVDPLYALHAEQIAAYLFSFNPEPGTGMAEAPRAPIARLRRIQLVKHLIEHRELARAAIRFDAAGSILAIDVPQVQLDAAIASGTPFMTDGCPDRAGAVACNRPYGSYRPGEPFRDYPFQPSCSDLQTIRGELQLAEVLWHGEGVRAVAD
ncbi:MAG: radical SAM protein [Planctomycetes bacterium]|nr:radical SAM protein [Planctomycetota bacterium]